MNLRRKYPVDEDSFSKYSIGLADGRIFYIDRKTGKCYQVVDRETRQFIECDEAMTEEIRQLFDTASPIMQLTEIMK